MPTFRTPHHLFVYGTLHPDVGHPMAERLERHAQPVGPGRIAGRLYDAGPYPALAVDDGPSSEGWVHGHVFHLDPAAEDELLRELDHYEGCPLPGSHPPLFVRCATEVRMTDGSSRRAWVYVYAREVAAFDPVPSGDWAAHRRARDG